MRLPQPEHKARAEAVVPMINVVFLLLVFFMMTSQIAPPAPIDITPPAADSATPARREYRLFLSAEGEAVFENRQGESAWQAVAALDPGAPLTIVADAALPVPQLARMLTRIAPERPLDLLVQP